MSFQKILMFLFIVGFDKYLVKLQMPIIEEGILEAKTECYAKDKVKGLPFFQSFYNHF